MSQQEIKISDRLLIRLHDDGTLDEVVSYNKEGECDFHMEQMSDELFWMRFYSTKERPLEKGLVIYMGTGGSKFRVEHDLDNPPKKLPQKPIPEEHDFRTYE